MAKPIKGTPVLRGKDADEVLREMRATGDHDYTELREALSRAVTVSNAVFRVVSEPAIANRGLLDGSPLAK